MQIRDYQAWLQSWDAARGWDKVLLSHVLMHAVEELGEVSKLVQMLEGYREPSPADLESVRSLLALELSDLQVMLFKLAYLCRIDMEEAMQRGMAKADQRFPDPAGGPAELEAAWQRFRSYAKDAGLEPLLHEPAPNS